MVKAFIDKIRLEISRRLIKGLAVLIPVLIMSCATNQAGFNKYLHEDYAGSAAIYEAVLKKNPDDKKALRMLGWSYFRLHRVDESLMLFQKLETLDPESDDMLEGLAWSLYMTGSYEDALNAFNRRLSDLSRKKPGNRGLQTSDVEGAGYCYYRLGNHEKALKYMKYAIGKNPDSVDDHVVAGFIYLNLKKTDSARIHFEKALELDPGNADSLAGLNALTAMDRFDILPRPAHNE